MWRIVTGLIILHLLLSFIDGIVVGKTDMYVTKLTVAMTDNVTTANVQNTEGWRVADYMWIGDEKIAYNGRTSTAFTNLTRGYDNTDAIVHSSGSRVYSRTSDAIRTSAGFNIVDIGASAGTVNMITLPIRFATTALPQLIVWNYSFLKEGNAQYLRMVLMAFSSGFTLYLMYQIASMLAGVAQGFLRRG